MSILGLVLGVVIVTGTQSKPDATGAYTVTLNIEHLMPVTVRAGEEWSEVYGYRLPAGWTVRRVRTFVGVDRGNVFEGHVIVQAEDFDLHRTSPHKEGGATYYDAYTQSEVAYRVPAAGAWLYVHCLARPTSGFAIAFHVGVILEIRW